MPQIDSDADVAMKTPEAKKSAKRIIMSAGNRLLARQSNAPAGSERPASAQWNQPICTGVPPGAPNKKL